MGLGDGFSSLGEAICEVNINKYKLLSALYFNEMNKPNCDLPLQHTSKFKMASPYSIFNNNKSQETPLNTITTDQQLLYTEREDKKYDLPRQRHKDQYLFAPYIQDRPVAIKNVYHNASKFSIQTKSNDHQSNIIEHHILSDPMRSRVTSIYERLLDQNKKNSQKCAILTQTTFKPKQLKTELSRINNHHQSTENLQSTRNSKQKSSSTKKIFQSSKKLNYVANNNVKTKYEQILEEHFQPQFNSKKKQHIPTAQDVRLSKIYKNSTIMKLKQKVFSPSLQYSSKLNKQKLLHNQQSGYQLKYQIKCNIKNQKKPQQRKQNSYLQNKTYEKTLVKPQNRNESKLQKTQMDEKNPNSQRWMSMNFHQRQQRVLSNRKQKESIGKQKNIQKEIKPCTFKPELIKKSKSLKTMPNEKQSYLQLYYDRLYKKY